MADKITTTYADGLWQIKGNGWAKTFADQCLVVCWGDPAHPHTRDHAVAVAGRCEDGTVDVHNGGNGVFGDVLARAVALKDLYLVRRGYCEPEPSGLAMQARRFDGLVRYELAPGPSTLSVQYARKPETWEHFVSRDHVCSLSLLPEGRVNDIESLITRLDELAHEGRVRFARRKWPALFEALGRDRASMAQRSIVRAAAHAVDRLYREPRGGGKVREYMPAYGNLKRRSARHAV